MEALRERSLPLLLHFIRYRTVSSEKAAKFHNDILNILLENIVHKDYELTRDSVKACMKIGHLMTLEESWFKSRSLLYWILYILHKGVISVELADDMILTVFRPMLAAAMDQEEDTDEI